MREMRLVQFRDTKIAGGKGVMMSGEFTAAIVSCSNLGVELVQTTNPTIFSCA